MSDATWNAAEQAEAVRRRLAAAKHDLVGLERRDGAWRWKCSCGMAELDWYVKANAVSAWQAHRHSWAKRRADQNTAAAALHQN